MTHSLPAIEGATLETEGAKVNDYSCMSPQEEVRGRQSEQGSAMKLLLAENAHPAGRRGASPPPSFSDRPGGPS